MTHCQKLPTPPPVITSQKQGQPRKQSTIHISVVPVADAPPEFAQLIYDTLYRDWGVDYDPIEQWYSGSLGGRFVVAHSDDDNLVGLCRLMPAMDSNPAVLQIRQVVVDDSKQGLGIGRKIMLAVQDLAKSEGTKELFLWSRYPAYGFYQGLGYDFFSEEWISSLTHINYRTMRKLL